MGLGSTKLEKSLGEEFPEGEHYMGFENYGSTCYCNSVLQALYFCLPFRINLLEYYCQYIKDPSNKKEDSILTCIGELFYDIFTNKKRSGVIGPKKFINKLQKENELFRGYTHQDAHEFLNFLLNNIAEFLEKKQKNEKNEENEEKESSKKDTSSTGGNTFIHKIFEGILTNETKCLNCLTVTSRDECFLDLSLDIEQNISVMSCLKKFSEIELLSGQDQFFCDKCNSKQDAEKMIKIKRLPQMLVLHLKRFKYIEQLQRHKKLFYRVVFPLELRLENTVTTIILKNDLLNRKTKDAVDSERKYELFAIVIHIGSGPNLGHYVSIIKSCGIWFYFDDEDIERIDEQEICKCFGSTNEMLKHVHYLEQTKCGYLLFYQNSNTEKNLLPKEIKNMTKEEITNSLINSYQEKQLYCI